MFRVILENPELIDPVNFEPKADNKNPVKLSKKNVAFVTITQNEEAMA